MKKYLMYKKASSEIIRVTPFEIRLDSVFGGIFFEKVPPAMFTLILIGYERLFVCIAYAKVDAGTTLPFLPM